MPTICNPEAYTYEDACLRAVEAFRAEERYLVEESIPSSATSLQRDIAAILMIAEKEENETGVSSFPSLKLFQQAAIADLLVSIESAFGLNVTELAKCLKASRQGIYDWRRLRSPAARSEHRERSERLNELAERWWTEVGVPVSRRLRGLSIFDGETFCDVLSRDDLSDASVDRALEILIGEAIKEKEQQKSAAPPHPSHGRKLGDLLESANE